MPRIKIKPSLRLPSITGPPCMTHCETEKQRNIHKANIGNVGHKQYKTQITAIYDDHKLQTFSSKT